jgi:hypothetical protein
MGRYTRRKIVRKINPKQQLGVNFSNYFSSCISSHYSPDLGGI